MNLNNFVGKKVLCNIPDQEELVVGIYDGDYIELKNGLMLEFIGVKRIIMTHLGPAFFLESPRFFSRDLTGVDA
jgi:hypothetical protein